MGVSPMSECASAPFDVIRFSPTNSASMPQRAVLLLTLGSPASMAILARQWPA